MRFLNMSKLVQIQYDTNCYGSCDFQTCLNMLKHVQTCSDSIWYELIRFLNMSEHVQTCLNLFRFNMILIVTIHRILKHVWTCLDSIWYELIHFLNMSRLEMKTWWNTLKLSKWTTKFFFSNWKAIPWIASSKSSDQKFRLRHIFNCVLLY